MVYMKNKSLLKQTIVLKYMRTQDSRQIYELFLYFKLCFNFKLEFINLNLNS